MSEGRSEGAETLSAVFGRGEALYRAGLLDDSVALFAASDLTVGATEPERLRIALAQGKIFADWVFHANRGYDEAVATLDTARALAARLGDERSAITALDLMGSADYYRVLQDGGRDYGSAQEQFNIALARREALDDTRGVAESVFHVGLIHERLEQYDEALYCYRRCYTLAREHNYQLEQSFAARHLGGRAQDVGDFAAALAYFKESLALRQLVGYTLLLPLAHIALGEVMLAQNTADGAAREYEQAHALAQGMQSPLIMVSSLLALSELAQARGDEGGRRDFAEQALARAQEDDLPLGVRAASAALAAITQPRASATPRRKAGACESPDADQSPGAAPGAVWEEC
jgi:tetratricopeptide (TPR) repeat protein